MKPYIDNDQRITRGMTSFALENHYEKTSGALSFFYNWGDHWINDGYQPEENRFSIVSTLTIRCLEYHGIRVYNFSKATD